ncbi:Flp pilus assembly protein CpaB [Clostridium sp. DL1XJH146]
MKLRHILILALLMALTTTFLFSRYLKTLDAKYTKEENTVQIIVPNININQNQKITSEMLETKELNSESVHPEAIRNAEDILGTYAAIDIKQGEILFSDRFINQLTVDDFVTNKIKDGYRALSLEFNFVESVSNLIEPEDYVDVIFSEIVEDTITSKETVITTTLLQNVRILAVGKRLSKKDTSDIILNSNNESSTVNTNNEVEYVSVTLELTSEDVVTLVGANEKGNLTLSLKSKIFPNK